MQSLPMPNGKTAGKPLQMTHPPIRPRVQGLPVYLPIARNASTEANQKRKRKGRPKSRTGCLTCKTRHVKCDELKPACQRCQSINVVCQGYTEPTARRKKNTCTQIVTAGPRPIAPRPVLPSPAIEEAPSPLLRSPSALPELSTEDAVYADYFRHKVVRNLAGFYTTSIWSRLVAGDGMRDDCIQHSVLAIGAFMHSVSQYTARPALRSEMADKPLNRHHRVALRHHSKALTSLRHCLQQMTQSSPATLITTTVLLAVFELLQGHQDTASSLVDSAISLLGGFSVIRLKTASTVNSELRELEWVLPTIATMKQLSRPLCAGHQTIDVSKMSVDFQFPEPGQDSISQLFTHWGQFFAYSIAFLRQSICYGLDSNCTQLLRKSVFIQQTLKSHLNRWKTILQSYHSDSRIDAAQKSALRLAQVHWLLVYITINCCLDPSQVIYDSYEDEFRELNSQCTALLRDTPSHEHPTSVLLGEGLVLTLSIVIRFCRNHEIRMNAVDEMSRIPWSMIAWDAQPLIDGLLGAVLLEERGRSKDGSVPPESRWFWLEESSAEGSGKSGRRYQRLVPDEEGLPVYEKINSEIDLVPDICRAADCRQNHHRSPATEGIAQNA